MHSNYLGLQLDDNIGILRGGDAFGFCSPFGRSESFDVLEGEEAETPEHVIFYPHREEEGTPETVAR